MLHEVANGSGLTRSWNSRVRIKANLIAQLTSPVRWTQTMRNMLGDGANHIVECGPGKVLQGLFRKMDRELAVGAA